MQKPFRDEPDRLRGPLQEAHGVQGPPECRPVLGIQAVVVVGLEDGGDVGVAAQRGHQRRQERGRVQGCVARVGG